MQGDIWDQWRLKNKGRRFEIWHVYRSYHPNEKGDLVNSFIDQTDANEYASTVRRASILNHVTVEKGHIIV